MCSLMLFKLIFFSCVSTNFEEHTCVQVKQECGVPAAKILWPLRTGRFLGLHLKSNVSCFPVVNIQGSMDMNHESFLEMNCWILSRSSCLMNHRSADKFYAGGKSGDFTGTWAVGHERSEIQERSDSAKKRFHPATQWCQAKGTFLSRFQTHTCTIYLESGTISICLCFNRMKRIYKIWPKESGRYWLLWSLRSIILLHPREATKLNKVSWQQRSSKQMLSCW